MANNITLSYPSAFHHQFLDLNGKPLTGGKLYTYRAGTSTSIPTYKTIGDTSSTNTNTNPIILDNAGVAHIVIEKDKAYKFVLFNKNDAKIDEWDNVTGNIGGGGGVSEDIVVVGTPNEIDVSGSVIQGVKRYVISLSNSVKITILQLIGLYNNVLNSLGNKADKVQGATAGNLAALDASGNLTDSGSKAADFKTKQTPVSDPSASGAGLEFIDSISQNANGVITPHKKTVQDGTTSQKGVVQLNNAIDSTSVTEAATPKAVKDAYDELNNKIVARAVFLSQAEWDVQSQLPGDPAKVYYVENGTGEDAYTVYVWKESTSTYEEVDESSIDLDGYWHDSPTTTGNGNVVTDITLGNDGVPQVTKGLTALTQHQSVTDNDPTLAWGTRSKVGTIGGTDLHVTMPSNPASGKLDTTGDASNTTSTFTKASGDSSSITSGSKLSVIFTAISGFFASVVSALGGKADKVASATNGNFASLDSNGNLTDSGKKAEDFAVSSVYNETDPRNLRSSILIHGTGTSFYKKIATMLRSLDSGNANFVLIRGFVGSWISSYENTEFELLIRTRQTSLMDAIVAKKYGKNPFTEIDFELYKEEDDSFSVWVKSSNSFTTGDFSVVAYDGAVIVYDGTNGTPTGTLVASASQNYKVMMVTDGDGSDVSVTPDGTSTGYDLGSSTTLKAFAQKFKNLVASLKALAFKDKASYSDLSSGVQSSLDKADSALQSHQSVTDNNPTLSWNTTSKVGKVGSTDLRVTMPSNPANNKQSNYLSVYGSTDKFVKLFRVYKFTTGSSIGTTVELIGRAGSSAVRVVINIKGLITADYIQFYDFEGDTSHNFTLYVVQDPDDSSKNLVYAFLTKYGSLYVNAADTSAGDSALDFSVFGEVMSGRISGDTAITLRNMRDTSWINSGTFDAARIPTSLPNVMAGRASKLPATQVGSPSIPVYVDSNGQVQACNPSQMSVGNATKWDGHAISIGSVSSSAGTISIV